MTIVVACPECDRRLKAPPEVVGKKIRCPSCEAVFLCQPEDEPAAEAAPKSLRPREEPEESPEDSEEVEERPRRRRRRRFVKKRSSAGLWIGLAVGGVLLLLLVVGGGAALIYLALRRPAIPDADWVAFTTPDGACTVQMPGTPTQQNLPVNGMIVTKYLLVRQREDVFFTVGYLDIPALAATPDLLRKAAVGERDNLIQKLSGDVIVDQDLSVLGNPGRDLQIRITSPHRGLIMERLFLVPNGLMTRLYIVGTGGSTIEPGSAVAAKFFDSLTVKATPAVVLPLPAQQPQPVKQPQPAPNQTLPPNWQPQPPLTPKSKKK